MPPVPEQLDLLSWRPPQAPRTPAAAPVQPACSIPLPDDLLAIFRILETHQGAEAAITAPMIAWDAGLFMDASPANRGTRVRKLLEQYQDAWPWPICGDANGYYRAATAAELSHYCANLRSRVLCNLRRFATVRRHGRRAGFVYLGKGRWSDSPTPTLTLSN